MRTVKKTNRLWILAALLVVAGGTWGVLFQTDLMPNQRATVSKFVKKLLATGRRGLIRGIVSGEDGFTALVDSQAVREGDSIYGVTVVKIYPDKVEFERNGTLWTQELNEIPGPQWRTQARAKEEAGAKAQAEAEARTQAEAEAKAKEEAQAKAQAEAEARTQAEAEARAKEEAQAKAQAEAEARTQAEAEAKTKEEAQAKAQAEAEARTQAEAEAKTKEEAQAEAEARAQAEAEAKTKEEAQAKAQAETEARAKEQAEVGAATEPPEMDGTAQERAAIPAEQPGDEDTQKRIAVLIGRLGDREPSDRDRAVAALEQTGSPAVAPLIAAMQAEDWIVRQGASQALGKIGDPRAVEPLISALGDRNQWIRRYAAEALGLIGDERALEPLVAALKDDSPGVRTVAAKALESIGGQSDASERSDRPDGASGTIIEKILNFKMYIGAAIAALLLLSGLAMVLFRGRKSI